MSVYEVAKDALKLAQKADNAELVQKILDVQEQALNMQEKQFELIKKIDKLELEISELKNRKKYVYDEGHLWKVDPENPRIKLCPTCLNRDGFENPLAVQNHTESQYCSTCKNHTK